MRHRDGRNRQQRRFFFGIVIILVGALALLENLQILDARYALHFWPVVFIAFGTLKIFQTRNTSGYVVGGALVALGVVMTLQHMGIVDFRWRDWWPVLLIAGGVALVFKGIFGKPGASCGDAAPSGISDDAPIDVVAVMSGAKTRNDTQNFRGGEITAVMGGVELDLRHASIAADATIHVFAMMGGIVISVPTDWTVVANGTPFLGGIEDKTLPPANPGKKLIIEGYAIMGGVEIKN